MKRLSIIVPMYNVEQFVETCLLSCVHQDLSSSDYEIIVVDDGSPDGSYLLAEQMQKQYSQIRIIRQQNQGLSVARNNGLAIAEGKYIWFVDSDDSIQENCIKTICDTMDASQALVLRIDASFQEQPGRGQCHYNGVKSWDVALDFAYEPCAPFYIYQKKLLVENQLNFIPNIYYEDSEFTPRVLRKAKQLQYLPQTLYYVRENVQSITHSINPKKAFDALFVASKQDTDFRQELNGSCPIISYQIAQCVKCALNNARDMDIDKRKEFDEVLKRNKHLIHHFFRFGRLDYMALGVYLYFKTL